MGKMRFYLVSLLLGFCISNSLSAQNSIIDFTHSTGFLQTLPAPQSNFVELELEDYSDSLLLFRASKSFNNGIDSMVVLNFFLEKTDLSVNKVDTLWSSSGQHVLYHPNFELVKDLANNLEYYITITDSVNLIATLTVNSVKNKLKDSVLTSFSLNNQIIDGGLTIYNDILYFRSFLIQNGYATDSCYLYAYNLNNNILQSRLYGPNVGNGFVNISMFSGPNKVFPYNDSLLVMEGMHTDVQFINRFTLDTAGSIELEIQDYSMLFANHYWGVNFTDTYIYDSTTVRMYGTLLKRVGSFTGPRTYNFFRLELGYDNTLIDYNDWGSDSLDERMYAVFEKNGNNIMAGASPFNCPYIRCAEYRQLLVYQESANSLDSLFIYGYKNHHPQKVFQDNNQDIYILSSYSNAWSNDSIYGVVTKVPATLLSTIEEFDAKVSSIVVYPNPTTDFIRSEEFEYGKEYQIFGVNGSLVKEGQLTDSDQLNVSNLDNGTYFIRLIDQNQQSSTRATMFIKR